MSTQHLLDTFVNNIYLTHFLLYLDFNFRSKWSDECISFTNILTSFELFKDILNYNFFYINVNKILFVGSKSLEIEYKVLHKLI